ncbi:MAG TPA: DUF3267 domain-containing protein [Candidatus Dorea gallistercoris]|uniref:DUF3267 domain-containing protein n=1 Tax=Candidatus Dorea gallistercoris TaxID=2838542 RepID=A0A9D1RA31_9FIRM|nr:DUF3267 domain-containing protein [Candidatus Dorea gallistercoris]
MAKEKKISPAKQKILDNYEVQRQRFQQEGYQEHSEVISVLKANVMVLVTAVPVMILGILIWILADRGEGWLGGRNYLVLFLAFLVTAFIHELLHGLGWCAGAKGKWKSMYIGMMWDSLTPYCHCKEPLTPGKYILGGLLPGLLLGVGLYIVAFAAGSTFLLWLSMLNILAAGGDLLIAWYARKYKDGYVLDHPTECGFVIFQKSNTPQ